MAKNEQTGKDAGQKASKLLKDKKSSPDVKTVAGSDLTQRPDKGKKKSK